VEWCRENNIAAVGIGSPWEPVSAAHYERYESAERDLYYSGAIDAAAVMDREEIARFFDEMNAAAGRSTLFYQDNETPKSRYGHLWYFGYHYDFPAWHDYSQDLPIQYYENDPNCETNQLTGKPHRRRAYLEVVAAQRKAGALAIWAHPTSWWRAKGKFVTNIAAELVLHLLADGHVDGMAVQGYDACHRSYQALWFHLLDTGAIIPGFAENDCFFDGDDQIADKRIFKNRMGMAGRLTEEKIVSAARMGRVFATSGPFLTISVDDAPMGAVCETTPGMDHRVRVEAYPAPGDGCLSRVELIGRGGEVVASVDGFDGGVLEFELDGADRPAYLVARAFGEHDDPDSPRQQDITHMAISNPIYLHQRGFRFKPVRTQCEITVAADSPWLGGRLQFQEADGAVIEEHAVSPGVLEAEVPAGARVHLTREGLDERTFYIAMENEEVQKLLRYLHDGEFLRDYPNLRPGEVPPEAFRLSEMRRAIQRFAKTI